MARILLLRGTIGSGKSSVARWIQSSRPRVTVIEVDEIKRRKYGTATRCQPTIDFPEAGRAAKESLVAGHDTIVVEAFCEEQHLNWVLEEVGLKLASLEVRLVWLECDVNTSIERKAGTRISPDVIRSQHARYKSRFRVPCERVINTVALTVEQVAQEVVAVTSIGESSGSG